MRDPDLQGPGGRAWDVLAASQAAADAQGIPASRRAEVGAWLIHQPGVHAFWSWWLCCCVHLRTLPGMPPALVRKPDATHEVLFLALHPDHPPDPDNWRTMTRYLTPADLVEQAVNLTDPQAAQLLRLCLQVMVAGNAAADSDWRGFWQQTIPATADHLRQGRHMPG